MKWKWRRNLENCQPMGMDSPGIGPSKWPMPNSLKWGNFSFFVIPNSDRRLQMEKIVKHGDINQENI
jgi:hypothetical protein